jgi:hypothetical protein
LNKEKPLIEVVCKDRGHWPSFYMQAAVADVLPDYCGQVDLRVVDLRSREGKHRLLALSCALYGQDVVYRQQRLAPVPGIFMDGQLIFDAIPDRDALIDAIERRLRAKGGSS